MAFFLETLLGGLMAGMLYSLVALGFVLIFKASGVFNFAQGAMVLFAALAMARVAEWIPLHLGITHPVAANVLAFIGAGVVMFVVAWVIERLVLRHLVNQEGTTLLMATLGITYFMEGLGQTIFGSSIYKIDIGMPKDPVMILESTFEGGILINKEDFYAALIAAAPDLKALQADFTLADAPDKDGLQWVVATPKAKDGQLQTVRVGFKAAELAALEILDSFGQRSLLSFNRLEANLALPASSFQFKPPAGADVIKQ